MDLSGATAVASFPAVPAAAAPKLPLLRAWYGPCHGILSTALSRQESPLSGFDSFDSEIG